VGEQREHENALGAHPLAPAAPRPGRRESVAEPAADRAFRALVAEERPGLVAVSAMIVGRFAAAEEVVQDVLERTYLRWGHVSQMDKPGAWVRRAVINGSISRARREGTERRALLRLGQRRVRLDAEPEVPLQEVWSAVRSLPAQQATAVALRYGADLSLAQVAEQMRLSESAVKALLHRARVTLRGDREIREMVTDER
jgi:RNA polymerase sigma-70 factor (ECF subfamily)